MDSRTRVTFALYLLMFVCFANCVAVYVIHAGASTGGYIMYALSLVDCALYGHTLYLLRRMGYDAERTLAAQTFADVGGMTWQIAAYFEIGSLVCLLCALLQILLFFGPGGRGRRDATTKLIGEKSRALLARVNGGVAADPSEG